MLSPHSIPTCTDAIPPQYWIASTVLMLFLHSTDAIPQQYCGYPLQYWIASTVLTLSPTCTAAIPSQYWTASAVLMIFLRSADAIPPQCLCYSPQYWCYPPHVLILSPHSTEQLPQYWTASAVLNRRYTGWSGHNKLADCIEIGNGKSSIKKRIFIGVQKVFLWVLSEAQNHFILETFLLIWTSGFVGKVVKFWFLTISLQTKNTFFINPIWHSLFETSVTGEGGGGGR